MDDTDLDARRKLRPAFDTWGKPGTIKSMVLAQWDKDRHAEVDPPTLIRAFEKRELHGIARLISYLVNARKEGRITTEIGSGSVPLTSPPAEKFTFEAFVALQEIYVGDERRGILPLQWLSYLERSIDSLDRAQAEALDKVLGELGRAMGQIDTGNFDIVSDEDLKDKF